MFPFDFFYRLNALLSGARNTACIPTPLQANHSRFLASARTKVSCITIEYAGRHSTFGNIHS
jgi:hypothetical protein